MKIEFTRCPNRYIISFILRAEGPSDEETLSEIAEKGVGRGDQHRLELCCPRLPVYYPIRDFLNRAATAPRTNPDDVSLVAAALDGLAVNWPELADKLAEAPYCALCQRRMHRLGGFRRVPRWKCNICDSRA